MRSPLKARGRVLLNLGARGTRIAHVVRVVRYAAGPGAINGDRAGRRALIICSSTVVVETQRIVVPAWNCKVKMDLRS